MSGENPEYHVFAGGDRLELINTVNLKISEGWRPVGSLAIIQGADDRMLYLQPMMRWPKLTKERNSE